MILEVLKKKKEKFAVNYKDGYVVDQIKADFGNILGIGLISRNEQTNSEHLYSINPLATYFTLYDIPNKQATICNLKYNDKPFNMPYGASSLLYNNRIIITGGTVNFIECSNSCYEYSLLMENVLKRKDILVPSLYHSMIVHDDNLYLIGGKNEKGFLNTCEVCNISCISDSIYDWREINPLNEAKAGIAVCTYEKYIYTFGGMYFKRKKDVENLDTETIDEVDPLGTIERYNTEEFLNPKWEIVARISNLLGYHLGVIEGNYNESKGFFIFGGLYKKNTPMKETYFITNDGFKEYKDIQAVKLEGCEMKEDEGLYNKIPKWQRSKQIIWVAGKSCLHYLSFDKSPNWSSFSDYQRQLMQ